MLIHEAVARSCHVDCMREAEQMRRAVRVVAQRRWERKADRATDRARAMSAAIL